MLNQVPKYLSGFKNQELPASEFVIDKERFTIRSVYRVNFVSCVITSLISDSFLEIVNQ